MIKQIFTFIRDWWEARKWKAAIREWHSVPGITDEQKRVLLSYKHYYVKGELARKIRRMEISE